MRIALVNTLYPPDSVGGAERSVRELALSLVESGHRVMVITLGPSADGTRLVDDGEVSVLRIGSRAHGVFAQGGKSRTFGEKLRWHASELAHIRTSRALRRALKSFDPHVVHANNLAGFGWLGWWAARHGRSLFVQTLRDYYLTCLATTNRHHGQNCGWNHPMCRIAKAPFRISPARPDVFVGVSASIIREHRRMRVIRSSDPVSVVYNRPEPISRRPAVSELSSSPYTFGVLGRLSEEKGSLVVVEAFARLPEAVRARTRLVLAGPSSGADAERLEAAVGGLANVEVLGWQDPASFFGSVDCVLVPSQWEEPFGRVAAESLQSGIAVLMSRAGALPEVAALYGGRFEIVDDFRDAQAWAQAMDRAAGGSIPDHSSTLPAVPSPAAGYLELYSSKLPETKEAVAARGGLASELQEEQRGGPGTTG